MPQSSELPSDPPPDNPSWSSAQLNRLQFEWQNAVRCYAYHPFVRIVSLHGEPPVEYEIEFRVRTLEIDANGRLGYAPACSIKLSLPTDFPHRPPQITPMQAIFHPNIDNESIQIFPAWKPSLTLVDIIERIGKMLAFQSIDPQNIWNPIAWDWVNANPGHVPTDTTANLSKDAGGDPLDRICRSGPATLPAIREQLRAFSHAMLDPLQPIPADELHAFSQRLRLALHVFLDAGIPTHLATEAVELNVWVDALPDAESSFATLRSAITAIQSSTRVIDGLNEATKLLDQQLESLQQFISNEPSNDPRLLLQGLPGTADLQKSQGLLRGLLAKTEQRLAAAQSLDQSLRAVPSNPSLPTLLRKLIDHLTASRAAQTHETREQLQSAYSAAASIVSRARDESACLDLLLLWREFVDITHRAQKLSRQILEWGAAGVHAYFLNNDAGQHGPFDFEQQVDLGSARIAVRRIDHHTIEAIDLMRGTAIGRSEIGNLSAVIPGRQPPEAYPTTLRPTPRCDDLAMQLDYAVTQSCALLHRLREARAETLGTSPSARHAAALATPSIILTVSTDHQTLSTRWAALAADLRSLAPFKERIATYHLLTRAHEAIPLFLKDRSTASALREKTDRRLAEILSRASADPDSGGPMIPGKLHHEYESLLTQGETSQMQMEHCDAAIAMLCEQVLSRTAAKKATASPIGSAKIPHLNLLPEMPADMKNLSATMSDQSVLELVSAIEALTQTQLYFGRRPTAVAMVETPAVEHPIPEEIEAPDTDPTPREYTTHSDFEQAAEERADDLLLDWT